jgi:hypothetical protein
VIWLRIDEARPLTITVIAVEVIQLVDPWVILSKIPEKMTSICM